MNKFNSLLSDKFLKTALDHTYILITNPRSFSFCSARDDGPNGTAEASRDFVGRKRMRANEASTHNGASDINHWDRADISGRIHQIALDLHGVQIILNGFIKDHVAGSNQYQSNSSDTRP